MPKYLITIKIYSGLNQMDCLLSTDRHYSSRLAVMKSMNNNFGVCSIFLCVCVYSRNTIDATDKSVLRFVNVNKYKAKLKKI